MQCCSLALVYVTKFMHVSYGNSVVTPYPKNAFRIKIPTCIQSVSSQEKVPRRNRNKSVIIYDPTRITFFFFHLFPAIHTWMCFWYTVAGDLALMTCMKVCRTPLEQKYFLNKQKRIEKQRKITPTCQQEGQFTVKRFWGKGK